VRELHRVAEEEHRGVVADHVVVALGGVELEREAADVAPGVGGAQLTGDGREPQQRLGLGAGLEDGGLGVGADTSWVTVKVPNAPAPLACGRRSTTFSRLKWASVSTRCTSCSTSGPLGPTEREWASLSATAASGGL
jgi:hypothetical protein